ncbi:MAG: hypothetical protein KDA88_08995 [Planctomycetaceae bacterium]|nr:hypothetical protein [Planctomycetaceae bacterium]MCA9030845.1 hypothetical protein [Planctomycetaceae bacterium]MCB9949806.1 hypothetical protein [Planctomycetaceae bacterium]
MSASKQVVGLLLAVAAELVFNSTLKWQAKKALDTFLMDAPLDDVVAQLRRAREADSVAGILNKSDAMALQNLLRALEILHRNAAPKPAEARQER